MISAAIRRNKNGHIYGYTVIDHGTTDVCAAVSILTLNTANSLEALTKEIINCEYDPKGGFLQVELPKVKEGHKSPEANLLLEAMALGLYSVKENYSSELEIKDDSYD